MNMKAMIEKRNSLVEEVNAMFAKAETEVRGLNEEENAKYDELTAEIRSLDETMEKMKQQFKTTDIPEDEKRSAEPTQAESKTVVEARAFEQLVRENRVGEMAKSANGAVIPETIANRILDTVKQIAPLYALTTKFNVPGKLDFPVASGKITTAYANEFTALTSSAVTFTQRQLDGFLVGALSKVSISLVNNAKFDIVSYVVNKVAESIALFIENEIINGKKADGKMLGILQDDSDVVGKVTIAGELPTADEYIAIQAEVPEQNQADCRWLVSKKTLLAMRQLKDETGRYFLQNDLTAGFGYTFLGKPVMVSDQMADNTVVYGDFSAVYVNIHEDVAINVLNEKFADEHAVGIVAWLEIDAKPIEEQKLVVTKKA